jgi:hypothetical protein
MADDNDDVTVPVATSATLELDNIAEMLRALWHELKKTEEHVRDQAQKGRRGEKLKLDILAAHMRATGDLLSDRANRVHDIARRFEPRDKRRTKH